MVVTPQGTASISELYDIALAEYDCGAFEQAATRFIRVFELDPEGPLAAEAAFRAGVAHDQAGDSQTHRLAALTRFEQVARAFPRHPLATPALIRALRLLVLFERWQRAAAVGQTLLGTRQTLRPIEDALVRAAVALGHLEHGQLEDAERQIATARTSIEQHNLDAAGKIPRDLAALYFALGELRRRRAEAITFEPLPKDFPAALERRAQLILDAQAAYSDAMRAEDAHWSTMAGHQVGILYSRLHDDIMAISPPTPGVTPERRRLFEGAMRLRYSVLLDKALAMIERTLAMAARTGESSPWVELGRHTRARILQAREREQQALDKLPYSRQELREALNRLAKGPDRRIGP